MTHHTRGPWLVGSTGLLPVSLSIGRNWRTNVIAPGAVVARAEGATQDEAEANANLVAACWTMHEACVLALKRLTELNRDDEAGLRTVLANAIAATIRPISSEKEKETA